MHKRVIRNWSDLAVISDVEAACNGKQEGRVPLHPTVRAPSGYHYTAEVLP